MPTYKGAGDWGLFRGFLRFSRATVLMCSLLVGGAFALGAWYFRARYGADMLYALWLAAATVPLFALAQLYEAMLRGLGFAVLSQFVIVLLHPIVMGAGFLALVLWPGSTPGGGSAMASTLAATAVALVVLGYLCHRKMPRQAREAAPAYQPRTWLVASASMMFVMSFGPVINQLSIVIVGALDGNAAAGIYAAAVRITNLTQIMLVAVVAVFSPMAADLFARNKAGELRSLTTFCARIAFAGTLAMVLFIAAFGWAFLEFLGPELAAGYPVLLVLAGAQLLFGLAAPAGILLTMTGHHKVAAKIYGISAVVNVVLCLALVPIVGGIGAAVATAVATGLSTGLMAYAVWRKLRINAAVTLPLPRGKGRPSKSVEEMS